MEENPLLSSELSFGVPAEFNEILDDILDDSRQISTDLDSLELLKDYLEQNSRQLNEAGLNAEKKIKKAKLASIDEDLFDQSPNKEIVKETPSRFTEAFRRTLSKLGLAPETKVKKKVRFADDIQDSEDSEEATTNHKRTNSKTIVVVNTAAMTKL